MSHYEVMRRFGLKVPEEVMGVDPEILRPVRCWDNKQAYKDAAKSLAEKFVKNFERYEAGVPADVIKKGGPDMLMEDIDYVWTNPI